MTKVCDKCGREFPEDREDCPRCGSRVSIQKESVGGEAQKVQSQTAVASTGNEARKVGIGLIIGIIFLPFIFAWLLLRNGYSKTARIISFAWLAVAIFAVGSNKSPTPVASEVNHQQSQSMPSGQESNQAIDLAAGDLFHTSEKYNGKLVKIKGTVSNTDGIFKKIHKGIDPDAVFNLDGRIVNIPDDETIKKESQVYGIDADLDRSLYPCISLELSGKSRGGAGMSNFGDILFVFTGNRDALAKLKLGQKINVVGKVDGTVKDAVIVRNCQLVK